MVPDFMPNLVDGYSDHPEEGGCLMQLVSFLYDGGFTDHPQCTDGGMADVAICVNDAVFDDARRLLMAGVPDLIGTAWLVDDADLSEVEEDAAITSLDEWVRATCPLPVAPECDACGAMHRWDCLTVRIEIAVANGCGLDGPLVNVEKIKARWADPNERAMIEAFWGKLTVAEIERVAHTEGDEWKVPHYALAAWFVAFVHKYRELFGAKPGKPVLEEQWRKAADALQPA